MSRSRILVAAAACLALAATSWADAIRTRGSRAPINGDIRRMTPQEIEIETNRGITKTVAVNEIESVRYADEPSGMVEIRNKIGQGDYEGAGQALEALKGEEGKQDYVLADIDFYKALCAARQALGGNGDIIAAGKSMAAFRAKYTENYHYLEACEVLGDLLVAKGYYAKAEAYYRELAAAPWEDYKMRAGGRIGRALLAQGKTAQALAAFEEVLGNETVSDQAEPQRRLATLGKARCLAAGNQAAEAVKLAQKVIDKLDAEDARLNAEAYNTLGTALRKAGRAKDALIAFLHVDVLYSEAPDTPAEALANLVELFTELHKPDHASACMQTLRTKYPDSTWTARAAKATAS